jgi:predicted transcriptional regulator
MPKESEIVRYTLRLPSELHAVLVELAKRERRSLHGEMLRLLEDAVRREQQADAGK